jgi:hypothetical protein
MINLSIHWCNCIWRFFTAFSTALKSKIHAGDKIPLSVWVQKHRLPKPKSAVTGTSQDIWTPHDTKLNVLSSILFSNKPQNISESTLPKIILANWFSNSVAQLKITIETPVYAISYGYETLSLTLRKHRLRASVNKMLRTTCRFEKEKEQQCVLNDMNRSCVIFTLYQTLLIQLNQQYCMWHTCWLNNDDAKYQVWQKSNATGNDVHEPKMLLSPPSHGS